MKIAFAAAIATLVLCRPVTGLEANAQVSPAAMRVFEEPLVPTGVAGSDIVDQALVSSLRVHQKRSLYEDTSAITSFLNSYPQSRWNFSLLANEGIIYRKTGHYSKAVDVWEEAWALGKGEKDYRVQALANQVAMDLATLLSSLGRNSRLKSLLAETNGRPMYGSVNAMFVTMKENLWLMENKPGDSFKCGPYALNSIQTFLDPRSAHDPLVEKAQSSANGYSLTQVRDLSNALKMNYQMAKRASGSSYLLPAVVHWKSGHYAAILRQQGAFYVTQDPTFGTPSLVTQQALEEESDGYFLVPNGNLPEGWNAVADAEGNEVWGRGVTTNRTTGSTKSDDGTCGPCSHQPGMAGYTIFTMLVSLSIRDTPVGYTPPIGPDVHFTITYNQLEANQPANFSYFNFGSCWNCSWLAYVTPPTTSGGTALVNTRGGGQESYTTFTYTQSSPGYTGYYSNELQSQATLWVTNSSPATYERRLPNGSKEVYGLSDTGGPVFLTAITDPQGNSIILGYDTSYRLTTVTDALGLKTTLTYGQTANPADSGNSSIYLVTKVTDPYGRFATFGYTSTFPYQLVSITDVIGIQSQFIYGSGSAITQLQTPYGNTTFTASTGDDTLPVRSLLVVEPDNSEIYAESRMDGSNYPYGFGAEPEPSGYGFSNGMGPEYLSYRNTYYWDKKAMQVTNNNPDSDYTKAYIYHFLHTSDTGIESGVLESEKPALENRIWYNYPGQPASYYAGVYTGTSANPTIVARVMSGSNSSTQATQYQYNNAANPAAVTAVIDPVGRQANYVYDSGTGIDLITVTQVNGSATDPIKAVTYDNVHNPAHCPKSITDAASQTTSYTYNAQGQITSVTPPLRAGQSAETTTYGYTNNFLTSVTRPLSGAVTSIAPDTINGVTINRPHSVSDAESYTLTYSYDNLDRVTLITYPDTTTEQFSYNINGSVGSPTLDLQDSYDRLGRNTHRVYDSVRNLKSVTDPLNQMTQYGWCICGALASITDPKGNVTTFNRDAEARVVSKVYQDTTQTSYIYDTATSRLATRTDARGNVATYSYNLDDTVSTISYAVVSGTAATPNVAYTYDPYYNRMLSANGVYISYVPAGTLGAGQALTETNTLSGGTAAVSNVYDEWGRAVTRNIDSGNSQTVVFDSLGRPSSVANPLGTFGYTYYDPTHPTNRLGGVSFPNGQNTAYSYFGNSHDERLQEIKHTNSLGAVISQHDYTYDVVGKIQTWQQQTDNSTPLLWTFGYDNADQLTSAVETNTAIPSPAIMQYGYNYDAAGNDYNEQIGTVTRSSSTTDINNLNQVTKSSVSGNQTVYFTGPLNGASSVIINGTTASKNSTSFSGAVTIAPGSTNTVTVVASDSLGNSRTNKFQTTIPAQLNYTPSYDNDGNELVDGAGQTYTWDAKSQLISISYTGGSLTTFNYDAFGRRISIVETGSLPSTKQFVWVGTALAEERSGANAVTKRFFSQGEQIAGQNYYYTRDHLGTVRELVDGTQAVRARYSYDPYGVRSANLITSNSVEADFGFTGHYFHFTSGLHLALYRDYASSFGRWLTRDPIAERGGINLYRYVYDDPISFSDPLGLLTLNLSAGLGFTFAIGPGVHVEVNVGIALDLSDPLNSNAFVNAQGDVMFGKGAFFGAGGQAGAGLSAAPPCPGRSITPNLHAEADIGEGEGSVGASVDYSPDSLSGAVGVHPGEGFGAYAGAGAGVTETLATPSLGSMLGLRP